MGNIKGRLMKLESRIGVSEAVIVVRQGETVDQAQERYFAQYPEHKLARKKILVCFRDLTRGHVERD